MSQEETLLAKAIYSALGCLAGAVVSLVLFGLSAAIVVAIIDDIGRRHGL